MAYTDIDKPSDYFNTVLYTGNGSTQSITGVGFQPDWVWLKQRNTTRSHWLFDIVRGATERLHSDDTNAEATESTTLTSFDSDGFTLGSGTGVNQSSGTYASWNWLADNTSGSSNTDGSITSTVSANTTSGFSIVSYTGNGIAGATIGHGLGTTPGMIITKTRNTTQPWRVYHKGVDASAPEDYGMILNDSSARDNDNTAWNDTAPTSSVFSVGTSANTNGSGNTFIAYCFAEKKGFSKFGSYTGNGSTDGTFVYTGFKPAWFLVKQSSASGQHWYLFDNKRDTFNAVTRQLYPSLSNAESNDTGSPIDFTSNGVKIRNTSGHDNTSGATYIYMAFAENPLVGTNNIPATAR